MISYFAGLGSVALAFCSVSCGIGAPPPRIHGSERVLYRWHDDGGPGKVSIRISLPDQIAEFQRDGRNIGWCYVATGKEGHGTTAGSYTITEKIVDKHSNRYGWIEDEFGNVVNGDAQPKDHVPEGMVYVPAPMPYWMRITSGGIGMHGGLIPEPGKPASHGCIRMPKEFVPVLYESVEVGTPVTITNTSAKHGPVEEIQTPPPPFEGDRRVIATRPLTRSDMPTPGRRMTDPFSIY